MMLSHLRNGERRGTRAEAALAEAQAEGGRLLTALAERDTEIDRLRAAEKQAAADRAELAEALAAETERADVERARAAALDHRRVELQQALERAERVALPRIAAIRDHAARQVEGERHDLAAAETEQWPQPAKERQ